MLFRSIVDPFHGGAILNEAECRQLLEPHMDDAAFDPSLLARATRRHVLVRMLLNLKKLYVKMHSFPQARVTTDALLALQPSSLADLRDRGLLAYHINDFSHALRDLEEYLEFALAGGYVGAWPWSFSGTDRYGRVPREPLLRFARKYPELVNSRAQRG